MTKKIRAVTRQEREKDGKIVSEESTEASSDETIDSTDGNSDTGDGFSLAKQSTESHMAVLGQEGHDFGVSVSESSTLNRSDVSRKHRKLKKKLSVVEEVECNPMAAKPIDNDYSRVIPLDENKVDLILVYTKNTINSDDESILDSANARNRIKNEAFNRHYKAAFQRKLNGLGIRIEEEPSRTLLSEPVVFVKLSATWQFLINTADKLHIKLPVAVNDLARLSTPISRFRNKIVGFFAQKILEDPPFEISDGLRIPFRKEFYNYFMNFNPNQNTTFTDIQRSLMVQYQVSRMRIVMHQHDNRTGILLQDEVQVGTKQKVISFDWLKYNGVYGNSFTWTGKILSDDDYDSASEKGSVDSALLRTWLNNYWAGFRCIFKKQPLNYVHQYFGTDVTFYFAWIGLYTTMLVPTAIFGVICLLVGLVESHRSIISRTVCSEQARDITVCRDCPLENCHYSKLSEFCKSVKLGQVFDNASTIVFSIFLSIWSITFLTLWKRRQNTLASLWHTSNLGSKRDKIRTDYAFQSKFRKLNPINKKVEPYMPKREKAKRFCLSAVAGFVLLSILAVNIVGLFLYKTISVKVFQASSGHKMVAWIGPHLLADVTASFLNLIFIVIMSYIYRGITYKMTCYENHKTQGEFERIYTYKVMIFQFFNYYGTLIYLGLIYGKVLVPPFKKTPLSTTCGAEGCLTAVSIQLMFVITFRQLFEKALYFLLPSCANFCLKIHQRRLARKTGNQNTCEGQYFLKGITEPEAFSDYTDMMIQYGFIVMFGSAFPLAILFALLNNIFEIRIAAKKYITQYRRPVPSNSRDIGPWMGVFTTLTKIGVAINACLIAFTTTTIEAIYYKQIVAKFSNFNISVVDYTFSRFATADYNFSSTSRLWRQFYKIDSLESVSDLQYDITTNTTITECVYRGMYFGPDTGNLRYTHRPGFLKVVLFQIGFLVIFQNGITLAKEIMNICVSKKSFNVRDKELMELYLEQQISAKYEMEQEALELAAEQGKKSALANSQNFTRAGLKQVPVGSAAVISKKFRKNTATTSGNTISRKISTAGGKASNGLRLVVEKNEPNVAATSDQNALNDSEGSLSEFTDDEEDDGNQIQGLRFGRRLFPKARQMFRNYCGCSRF